MINHTNYKKKVVEVDLSIIKFLLFPLDGSVSIKLSLKQRTSSFTGLSVQACKMLSFGINKIVIASLCLLGMYTLISLLPAF